MSKLYMKATSDACKSVHTMRGHKSIEVQFFYGSAHNPVVACLLELRYNPETLAFSLRATGDDGKNLFDKILPTNP